MDGEGLFDYWCCEEACLKQWLVDVDHRQLQMMSVMDVPENAARTHLPELRYSLPTGP
jgi:hypothetical protein